MKDIEVKAADYDMMIESNFLLSSTFYIDMSNNFNLYIFYKE